MEAYNFSGLISIPHYLLTYVTTDAESLDRSVVTISHIISYCYLVPHEIKRGPLLVLKDYHWDSHHVLLVATFFSLFTEEM